MVWAIDKESSFLSAARPSVHPVLWLSQISVNMQGSVPLELSGQCCLQPAFKARQAVSCFEVWLFAFVFIQQRRNSCQGEDGLTSFSAGSQLEVVLSTQVDNLSAPHMAPTPCCVTLDAARMIFAKPCGPAWLMWKPCPKISSIIACSFSKYQTQGSSDHSHDQLNTSLPFLSRSASVHTQSCDLPTEKITNLLS